MGNTTDSYYFRRRTIGRAASPPTWACYEQIPYEDEDCSDSCSDSCSEDDEDYSGGHAVSEPVEAQDGIVGEGDNNMNMDTDDGEKSAAKGQTDAQREAKGKQRAIEPDQKTKRQHRKKEHQPMYTLRPILTIQRSQGFVWNQDLFVPPYIKDRYVASTSPPNSKGFISTSVSSNNSAMTDYEVEVVEIRVQEGELDDIIP